MQTWALARCVACAWLLAAGFAAAQTAPEQAAEQAAEQAVGATGAALETGETAPVPRPSPRNAAPASTSGGGAVEAPPAPRISPRASQTEPADGAAEPVTASAPEAEQPAEDEKAEAKVEAVAPEPATAPEASATEPKEAEPTKIQSTEAAPTGEVAQAPATSPSPEPAPRPWFEEGRAALQSRLAEQPIEGRARNVVLMIGDGMGVATATAIRLHVNQAAGGLGEEQPLPFERFAHSALVNTYTVNAQTGDGAATATAIMSGQKTRSGVLGLDQTAVRGRCGTGEPLQRLGDLFAADGRAVGYVTTARLTHSTPAAGYGVSVERLWEHDARMPADCLQRDLAQQLAEKVASAEIDVALGGGRAAFVSREQQDSEGETGARADGRNLIEEATAKGVRYVETAAALSALDAADAAPVLGLFASGSMSYEHDRGSLRPREPALADMAEAAINALETASQGRGYFLMIEGGRIGQASHYGNMHRVVTDGAAFAEAVERVSAMTNPADTLILVTADAAHSLAFNGYCGRGSPVPGLCYEIAPEGERHGAEPAKDATGAPYETTGFLNGPGASEPSPALDAAKARDPMRRQRALVPMETETTSATDVPAYARGPWAHLLDGVVEQHFLFHLMRYAAFEAPLKSPKTPDGASERAQGDTTVNSIAKE